ncbi:hypothetical protein HDV00_002698 [Rhizophlyctis rosea]|nr:hypothetical protein HDV00_002698 [Rhizophlyctis rosea]
MGSEARRLITRLFPDALAQLGYAPDSKVHLVTYESRTSYQLTTVDGLRNISKIQQGGTYMAPVPNTLLPILIPEKRASSSRESGFLIVTVSDGEIFDQEETMRNASTLAEAIKGAPVGTIRSHAIRFDTGGQADTRALSSLLQLDNSGMPVELLNISQRCNDADFVAQVVQALEGGGEVMTLNAKGATLRRFPWATEGADTLPVHVGTNIFWVEPAPTEMTIDGQNVDIKVSDATLNRSAFMALLGKQFTGFLQRARVLKVVGTTSSLDEVSRMVQYFDGLERSWEIAEDDTTDTTNLTNLQKRSHRLKRHIQKTATSLRNQFNSIMNDARVNQMNASQQADYLRSVDFTKNTARGLARRGADSAGAFDFDEVTRKEVQAMHDNLSELSEVDDTNHLVSFYSRASTLEGIKTVCGLVEEDMLHEVTTAQVIELFNIVGVPCDAPIGDFPDAMSYRINHMHFDCYVSLADVLVYKVESGGSDLETPGTRSEIVNVVPVFEDPRIGRFLRKHAPTLLEYVASVGMRRIIVDVPMTLGYTLLAGVWKMVEILGGEKGTASEVAVRTFLHFTDQLPVCVGKYFAHTMPLLTHDNSNERLSYHLLNNGVTNMMVALLHGIRKGIKFDMSKLLRALYTFEVWQAVRKRYRQTEDGPAECERMIHRLFEVDFNKWKVPVTPLFEKDIPESELPATWPTTVSESYIADLWKDCWYIDYLTLLPTLFTIAVEDTAPFETKVAKCKSLTGTFTTEFKSAALGVPDLSAFRTTCILQALTYTTKKHRVDEETNLPILPDPGHEDENVTLISTTLRSVYTKQYAADIKEKTRLENEVLTNLLVTSLVSAPDMDTFITIMQSGVQQGDRTLKLTNPSCEAFKRVETTFFTDTPTTPIPLHARKLATIILGSVPRNDVQTPVWNNGNILLPFRKHWSSIFLSLPEGEKCWIVVQKERRERRGHKYRGGEENKNRHGHSDDLPSYFAMGYVSMEDFRAGVEDEVWVEYVTRGHRECCGCSGGVYLGPQ